MRFGLLLPHPFTHMPLASKQQNFHDFMTSRNTVVTCRQKSILRVDYASPRGSTPQALLKAKPDATVLFCSCCHLLRFLCCCSRTGADVWSGVGVRVVLDLAPLMLIEQIART